MGYAMLCHLRASDVAKTSGRLPRIGFRHIFPCSASFWVKAALGTTVPASAQCVGSVEILKYTRHSD